MSHSGSDLGRLIGPVAQLVLGDRNERLSSKTESRYGKNGSVAVDLEKGTYFDFSANVGGGVLDLIKVTKGLDTADAFAWMREQGLDVGEPAPYRNGNGRASSAPHEASKPAGKIIATYDYVDEAGELLFQVCRLEPKTFRQRRKDPHIAGEWSWSVKGVRQVPYRLPELIEAIADERMVAVCEGEKDVDNLRRWGIPATCNAGGAEKWRPELSEHLAGADVVIVPDNDDAGRKHSNQVGAALKGIASRIRVLALPGLGPKEDVSDWIKHGGTPEKFYTLVAEAPDWSPTPLGLPFSGVWFANVEKAMEEPTWLIDELLTKGDLSLIYGPSQSGKSFLATHLALAVARGEPVFDRKTAKGGVIYVAAEGKRGFKNRLKAYRQENGIPSGTELPYLLIPTAIDLFSKSSRDVEILVEAIPPIVAELAERFSVTLDLIVIDTHAAVSPGANENASEDMSRLIKNYQRIQEVSRAHLMIVHHKNAAGDKPRGHTSLYAGVDNAIEVNCDESKYRTAKVAKMKDAEDGWTIGFRLNPVTIGARQDGRQITSCVVVGSSPDDGKRSPAKTRLSDQQDIALRALREATLAHGEPAPSALQLPYGIKVVRASHWKEAFLRIGFDDPPGEGTFRSAFKRVGDALLRRGVIGRNQPWVWIAERGEASVAWRNARHATDATATDATNATLDATPSYATDEDWK